MKWLLITDHNIKQTDVQITDKTIDLSTDPNTEWIRDQTTDKNTNH